MQKLINSFIEKFSSISADQPDISEQDIHMAAALLLIEVGKADFHWQPEEAQTAIDSMVELFSLTQSEAQALVEEARSRNEEHTSLHPVISILNEHCSTEQKRDILFNCWQVAYADNILDRYEEANMRKISELLFLHHSDYIQTKLRAEEESRKRGNS